MRIAIIGAGIAGLAAARRLADAGHAPTLFDKGRGPGGRLSTKRWGDARVDLGAQYATARDPRFIAVMQGLRDSGHAAPWEPRMAVPGDAPPADDIRWVGVGGMSALAKGLTAGLDVRCGTRVATIARGDEWRLTDVAGVELGLFDAVLVATPAEQAVPLLASVAPLLAAEAAAARTAPCHAVALRFDVPPELDFDAARTPHPAASWVARQGSRPGCAEQGVWVVHASAAWSRAHLDLSADAVAASLAAAFAEVTGVRTAPAATIAHRWLYALVETPARAPFGWDATARLGSCGDWHGTARVEAAWRSGDALARAVANSLGG